LQSGINHEMLSLKYYLTEAKSLKSKCKVLTEKWIFFQFTQNVDSTRIDSNLPIFRFLWSTSLSLKL